MERRVQLPPCAPFASRIAGWPPEEQNLCSFLQKKKEQRGQALSYGWPTHCDGESRRQQTGLLLVTPTYCILELRWPKARHERSAGGGGGARVRTPGAATALVERFGIEPFPDFSAK